MARPNKHGVRYKVNIQLNTDDYNFLERNAKKFGISKSEVVRQIITSYRENNYAMRVVANLEEGQLNQLRKIASVKNMNMGQLTSAIVEAYLNIP